MWRTLYPANVCFNRKHIPFCKCSQSAERGILFFFFLLRERKVCFRVEYGCEWTEPEKITITIMALWSIMLGLFCAWVHLLGFHQGMKWCFNISFTRKWTIFQDLMEEISGIKRSSSILFFCYKLLKLAFHRWDYFPKNLVTYILLARHRSAQIVVPSQTFNKNDG